MGRRKNTEPTLTLTKAEEHVMQALWSIGQGFANEIMEAYPDPKPAYNTVLTIVRLLEKKGFVTHEAFNRSNRYKPIVGREEYALQIIDHIVACYFGGSYASLIEAVRKNRTETNKNTGK